MKSKPPPLQRTKSKVHVKFDKDDRREYLKGFRKRKEERRAKAKKMIAEQLKVEKKKIKTKQRELMEKMMNRGALDLGNYESASEDELLEQNEENDIRQNTVTNKCGSTTVQISGLNLLSDKNHLGINTGESVYDSKVAAKNKNKSGRSSCNRTNGNIKEDEVQQMTFGTSKSSVLKSLFNTAKETIKSNKVKNKIKKNSKLKKKKSLVTKL